MAARGQIPESFVQELLSRVDIAELVGRHVELRKGGANLLGLCPFHGEKTPSFTVSPSKQFFHCFGCGAHGDAIRFLMDHGGLGFVDAVKELAQSVGLQVPETQLDPAERERAAEAKARRLGITEALARAAEHFTHRLKDSPRAIDYLKRRGLDGRIARRFGLGYAPEGWRNLASAFPRYDDTVLVDAGLVIVQGEGDEAQKRYDRFRDRVMFPIRSVQGEVIGFGGRVLDQGEPKYLNSPETPVFVKGQELYGLFEARQAIREQGHALVVEGYMDVVALAQSGFAQAVATLGTACTPDHVRKLLRFTDHIVFSFDGDAAGRRAAARALEASLPHVNDLRRFSFLFLPQEHDPDSYVREHGDAAFKTRIDAALPLSQWLLDRASEGCDLGSVEGRARMVAQAQPLWSLMPAGALRSQILHSIAETCRMSTEELSGLWGLRSPDRATRRPDGPADPNLRRPAARRPAWAPVAAPKPQDHVTRMLLHHASLWLELTAADQELLMSLDTWHASLFRWLERDITENGPREWPALRDAMAGQVFEPRARSVIESAALPAGGDLEELRGAISQTARARALKEPLTLLGRLG